MYSKYLILLRKWQTAIRLVGEVSDASLAGHVEDAERMLPHIPDSAKRLIDVGSGGGLPSVVIALNRPDLTVVALEPIRKKHAFLSAVRRELCLVNLHALAQRDEQHRSSADFSPYDVATSRATFKLDDWLERGLELVSAGGRVLGLQGNASVSLPKAARRHPYAIDGRQRAVIVMVAAANKDQ